MFRDICYFMSFLSGRNLLTGTIYRLFSFLSCPFFLPYLNLPPSLVSFLSSFSPYKAKYLKPHFSSFVSFDVVWRRSGGIGMIIVGA